MTCHPTSAHYLCVGTCLTQTQIHHKQTEPPIQLTLRSSKGGGVVYFTGWTGVKKQIKLKKKPVQRMEGCGRTERLSMHQQDGQRCFPRRSLPLPCRQHRGIPEWPLAMSGGGGTPSPTTPVPALSAIESLPQPFKRKPDYSLVSTV